jgi:hypothetical protein
VGGEEVGEELGGCLVEEGVDPVGGKFGHRLEDEWAEVHTGVGQSELGGVNFQLVNGNDVNVDEAVDVSAGGIAMRLTADEVLDSHNLVEHLQWSIVSDVNRDAQIDENVVGVITPRVALKVAGEGSCVAPLQFNESDRTLNE